MNEKCKKILFFIPSYRGGAGKVICTLANYFSKKSECKVYLASNYGFPCEYKIDESIQVLDFYKDGCSQKKIEIKTILLLHKFIKENKVDCIVSFTTKGNFGCILATIGTKCKIVVSERSDPYSENSLVFRMRRKLYPFADKVIFQTDKAAQYYKKLNKDKINVIPNSVNVPSIVAAPIELRKKEIVSVTRLSNKQKRIDVLLQAFQIVAEKHPDYTLRVIGDGEDKDLVEKWIKEMGIKDRVTLHGHSNNVLEEIKNSYAFVLTSDFEGISNSMLEALSIGLPVVATNTPTGGAQAMIEDGVSGFVVDRGDIVGIADALCKIIEDDKLAAVLGNNAYESMKKIYPEPIEKMWDDSISELFVK